MTFYVDCSEKDEISSDEVKKALGLICSNQSADNMRSETVWGRILLGYILNAHYGIEGYELHFNENGKPYLNGEKLYFNVSHSDKYVMCSVSEKEVGCDVQVMAKYNPRISERYFTESENIAINGCSDKEKAFFRLWTLKESIIKAKGMSISDGLDMFCFGDCLDKNNFIRYGFNFTCAALPDAFISICSKDEVEAPQKLIKKDLIAYAHKLIKNS